MCQIATEIEINAPASRVWAILTDFARYPEWNTFILKLEGQPIVGTRLIAQIQPPGLKAMTFSPVVLKAERERELRWLGRLFLPRLFDGEHSFALEPVGEGRTLFRQSEQFRGILVPLLWWSMADQSKRGFEVMNGGAQTLGGIGMISPPPVECTALISLRPSMPQEAVMEPMFDQQPITVLAIIILTVSPLVPAAMPEPRMSYLDNGTIRIGVNLSAGGAITYLSKSGDSTNLVNNWDWGRQIQMSHYSGPVPFKPFGKAPAPQWVGLGWNPVQAGDHLRNASKIIADENDGKTIYVKCIPMQYALNNVPAECTFECWITLNCKTIEVRNRMVVDRPDKTQYPARGQELPAIYTNGTFYRLMSYTGENPFTDDKLTGIEKSEDEKRKGGWPWVRYQATENWAALVNDRNWGVGIWEPGCTSFVGGFAGKPGKGGTNDAPTGYISPVQDEIIDHNISYEYRYVLIVGSLQDIRKHVYDHAQRPAPPVYRFDSDRQHWTYRNAVDTGWPIKGELHVLLEKPDPQLIGPPGFWFAKDAPKLRIEAAFKTEQKQARFFWKRFDDDRFSEDKSMRFESNPDGQFHVYEIDLSASQEYRGVITGLRFDPVLAGGSGDWVKVRSISLGK